MNHTKAFLNQQYGNFIWKDSDMVMKRLWCTKEQAYTQLLPPVEESEFYRDTPIFACKFASQEGNEHLVALANEDGHLALHDSITNTRYGINAHNNAIFDLAWMFEQMKLVTASGDHTSKLYSIENGEIREERVFCGHTRSVKTVAFRKGDSSVFATGGRDGTIILWDIRSKVNSYVGKLDRMIENSHTAKVFTPSKSRKKFSTPSNSGVKSVTGLVFQDDNTLVSCGAGDGIIKIWDLRRNYLMYKREPLPKTVLPYPGNTTKNGYSSLVIDNDGVKLYANCLDNTIYCYNMASYNIEPVMHYVGHQNSTFYVKSSLSKSGNYLVSGSSDENAYIWNTKHSLPLVKLTGHTAEVTCVAWCHDKTALITCSDDMTHKIWTVGPENLPENEETGKGLMAEIYPVQNHLAKVKLKRPLAFDVLKNTPKKFFISCKKCSCATNCSKVCENCDESSAKRKSDCELMNESKKIQSEFGPRKLFANINLNVSNTEDDTLAKCLDPKNESNLIDCEPPRKLRKISSPSTCSKLEITSSPTTNLPNYIVDGTAPHLSYSPPKKKSQDWLTKIRVERNLRQEMLERTNGPSSPKLLKLEITPRTKGPSSPKSPLLRFFRVTNNALKCDGSNCSKSHSCSIVQSNVQPS